LERLPQTDEDAEAVVDGDMTDRDPLPETPEASTASAATDLAPLEVAPTDDAFLAATANDIRARIKLAHSEVIEVGRLLAGAKKRLAHGQWLPWLNREFSWSESKALKLMQLHEAFRGESVNVTDLNLHVSSLYLIAAPKTPPEARDEVLRRAEAGEAVPRAEVKRIVQQAKAKHPPKEQRRAPSEPPARSKLAKPEQVGEEDPWSSWGPGAQIGVALHEFGDLVTGGDTGSLFGPLESAIRAMDERPRPKVLVALELLGRLDQALRKNPT
jgi:hypothetical protein